MNRREFVSLIGGAAAAWPLTADAQQSGERMRRIAVMMSTAAEDPESQSRLVAFVQGLAQLGWRIDTRWAFGDPARLRQHTMELVALAPDVILIGGRAASVIPEVQRTSSAVPIVVAQGVDP